MALLRAESEPLNGLVVMKGPRPLNANNQIPLAEVIRQLIALVNGDGPHRGRHHCRSNTVQPGLELLQGYQVIHGYPSRQHTHFPGMNRLFKWTDFPTFPAFSPTQQPLGRNGGGGRVGVLAGGGTPSQLGPPPQREEEERGGYSSLSTLPLKWLGPGRSGGGHHRVQPSSNLEASGFAL